MASRAAADEVRQFESATSEWMKATTEKLREENGDREGGKLMEFLLTRVLAPKLVPVARESN